MKVKAIVVTVFSLCAAASHAFALSSQEIATFQQGKSFIQSRNVQGYQQSLKALKGTTVAPYLEYYYVQQNLKSLPKETVLAFIERTPNTLFNASLSQDFYRYELEQKNYAFIEKSLKQTQSQFLRCIYDDAILKTRPKDFDAARFQSYWVKVATPLSSCLSVEKVWLDQYAPKTVVDQKINELIANLNIGRAKALLPHVPSDKRAYYQSMINVIDNPAGQLMTQKQYYKDSTRFYTLAVQQWGKSDSTNALKGLEFVRKNQLVTASEYTKLRNLLTVFQAGRADAVDPLGRIEAIAKNEQTDDVKISGFKLSAQAGQCKNALDYLERLSPKAKEDATWTYWQGRMHQCLGQQAKANELYKTIASQTSFYGFLAADELKQPYSVLASLVRRKADPVAPLTDANFKLGLDLMAVDERNFAHQAWFQGLRTATQPQKNSASFAAYEKGFYDLGIRAAVAARQPGALHIRYPMGYGKDVKQSAKRYGYPPELLWGLIRQESLFQPDAKSHANAYGLMQLLIPTAEKMAAKLGEKRGSLYDPVYNIRYGTAYLNDVSGVVGQHWPYILASYNAGPHKVVKWIDPPMADVALWVESIPYRETRGYVKSILENVVIYHYQAGNQKVRISDYLNRFYPQ
ncbi:lytic transglycosylase domain-containing protein [Wohlfahrtiimonas chitiniclastica]|uniref:lytic transglycosylase domain-containing protein n=1 Tax=Wohlfahrtiimonas chitiniclastica TaxID=400946 RepID=UPI000371C1FC|nr:lytic transglycosylase domain-containing protein [Wohlfahrtiimonas chitiniclastica]